MPTVKAALQKFDKEKGWYFMPIPTKISAQYADLADRGLIPITASVGDISWPTSLLPMGDGSHFIAIPQKVRLRYDIKLGNIVKASFVPR